MKKKDRQLIYAKLVEKLNDIAFFNLDLELADASEERKQEFMEAKRKVRQELSDIAEGKTKSAFDTSRYKTHDGPKGSPEQWREAAKKLLDINDENCLTTLGLSGIPASEADLKKVYRAAIRKAHPDVGGSEDEAARLNAAYELALKLFFKGGLK